MNILDTVFIYRFEVLLTAIMLDILMGEPPGILHPVVWMGKWIEYLKGLSFNNRRMHGLFIVIVMAGSSFLAGTLIAYTVMLIPVPLAVLIAAFFLKSTFSVRMLLSCAINIEKTLNSKDCDTARSELISLVSRDTASLDEPHLASAVIESTSENFVDGILSPLLYYLVLGLPGALVYKAVNTLDSMIGYKNEEFRELGRASARLDDVLNWIPARLSLPFVYAASLFFGNPGSCLKICMRDWRLTPSPNSGWPMAAASGALGVRLEKQGYYELGREFRYPYPSDITRAARLVATSTLLLFLLVLGIIFVFY